MIEKGKKVFIKTVTLYYLGEIVESNDKFITLKEASWVQDTGLRLYDFLKLGVYASKTTKPEIEPIGNCMVGVNQIVEICEWAHELPTEQI